MNPNGTLKWNCYKIGAVRGCPAIDENGVIHFGTTGYLSHLYAIYSNNGTLKWKYKTGDWIRVSPCIGDDGTIYVVSFDCYLHAVNPDGSLKWKTYLGEAGTSPTIGWDGTIYCGYRKLHAIYPNNGTMEWRCNVGCIDASPALDEDGTLYVGVWEKAFYFRHKRCYKVMNKTIRA